MCTNGSANTNNTEGKCGEDNKYSLKAALGDGGAQHWPKISADGSGGGTANKVDSTDQISGEMTGLKTEEKGTVAGLFAKIDVQVLNRV